MNSHAPRFLLTLFVFAGLAAASSVPALAASKFSMSLNPRYFRMKDLGFGDAFTRNGFADPKRDQFATTLTVFWTTDRDWQLGFAFAGLNELEDQGTSEASWSESYFGFHVAHPVFTSGQFELSLGTLLGFGASRLEVLSTAQNGRYEEMTAIVEPTLDATYPVSERVRLGLTASYLFPFAADSSVKGQGLGVKNISAQGWSAGVKVEFEFSRHPRGAEEAASSQ